MEEEGMTERGVIWEETMTDSSGALLRVSCVSQCFTVAACFILLYLEHLRRTWDQGGIGR